MPLLVRVRLSNGTPASRVSVVLEWRPSKRCVRDVRLTAAGLLVFPWRAGQEEIHLEFEADGETGSLTIDRSLERSGAAIDVALAPRIARASVG